MQPLPDLLEPGMTIRRSGTGAAWVYSHPMKRAWAALLFGLGCAHTPPSPTEDAQGELSERSLAKDVLLIQHDPGFAPANVLVVRMPDGTLVLCSSPYDTAATRSMVRQLRRRFRPARMVAINVHFHPDGTAGNEGYALEGVETYGSDLTREALGRRGRETRALTAQAASPRARARLASTPIVFAAKTFRATEGLRLEFGGASVQLIYTGPAHSPDNIVVHFPSHGLLFGGDLIRAANAGVGYRGDADLARWPAALDVVAALAFEVVVPGHGAPGGRELLHHTRQAVSAAARPPR
jgi:glyoxylase-like metal-dependent hydrolase (beta-lactamase superfamily II)